MGLLYNRTTQPLACLVVLGLLMAAALPAAAQERCQTLAVHELLKADKAKLPGGRVFEQQLAALAQNQTARVSADTSIYQIPVVFHIIHRGEPIGTGTNVSEAAVRNQVRVLNQDYRRLPGTPGFNTDARGADAKIEFVLTGLAPDSTPTTGINRYLGQTTPYSIGDNDAIKAFANWPPCQYLNIWVCDLQGGYLGFSTFPNLPGLNLGSSGAPYPEGVVLDYNTLPANQTSGRYIYGRTATHEIGHYLGLIHVWGDQSSCTGTDYCDDTPRQDDQITGCPTNPVVCSGDLPPMVANYLNYSDDNCMNIFTADQVARMRLVMNRAENRPCLRTSRALLVTSIPTDPEPDSPFRFQLYPNPSQGQFTLTDDSARPGRPTTITITDVLGRSIATLTLQTREVKIDLSNKVAPGLYFLQHTNGQEKGTLRLVVKRDN